MACLTDEQIEMVVRSADSAIHQRLIDHAVRCTDCGLRLTQARGDARTLADLKELRASRQRLPSVPAAQVPVEFDPMKAAERGGSPFN